VETPQTFYKKPADEEQPAPGITFTVDPPSNDVVADKVVEGIHKRMRDEGRPIANMALLCQYEPAAVKDEAKKLTRAFDNCKDLHIFLLTHGYLENFKEDAAKNLPIYELRHKYQTTYSIMYSLAQTLDCKFSVCKSKYEYRFKLREQYGVKCVNSEPQNAMQSSEIESRLELIESRLELIESQLRVKNNLLISIWKEVSTANDFEE
tara:strand:- start:317 stop:937 length:621 start_codon:yes stop_codon:yes gene_type:complete